MRDNTARVLDDIQIDIPLSENNSRYNYRYSLYARRLRKKKRKVSVVYIIATLACLFVCSGYLQAKSNIQSMENDIHSLTLQIEEIKISNEDARVNIEGPSLDEIKKRAKELGMIMAGKDDVRYFRDIKADSVRQYGEIPEK